MTPVAFRVSPRELVYAGDRGCLHEANAALCIAESDDLVTPEIHPSATHTSFRLRRNGGYSAAEVAAFAKKFAPLATSRDVYVYFKHEDERRGAERGCTHEGIR